MNIMHSTKFVKWSLIRRLSKHVSRGWSFRRSKTVTACCSFYCTGADLVLHFRYFCTMSWMAINYWLPSKYCRVEPKLFLHWDNGETVLSGRECRRQLQLAGKQIQIDLTTLNYKALQTGRLCCQLAYIIKLKCLRGGETLALE